MNKRKDKQPKQTNNLNKFLGKNNPTEDKSSDPPLPKNEGKKKVPLPNCNSQTSKEKPIPAPFLPKKHQIHHLLKETSIDELLQKCPILKSFAESLAAKTLFSLDIVISIIKKYLYSSPHCLWSRRYAPKQIAELFNVRAGKQIKEWIEAFFEYKNKIVEQDSFINDYDSSKSNKIKQKIRENEWQLHALIVRGRPGIGKTSAIRAVAHEMDIDLQQCGNEYNHTKYLKQKNESTQSESVKTAYTRKVKIEKNSHMITKFMPVVQKQKPKQSKKGQMVHNISKIFPEQEASRFYHELSRCVQLSKIPFIMTNSGEKLPKECEKYDIIEFDSGAADSIAMFLWLIFHLECIVTLNRRTQIEKDTLFEYINSEVATLEFRELCPISKIKEVCQLFNYRLDYVFTFIEHNRRQINKVNLFPLLIEKYKSFNEDKLLEEILFIDFKRLRVTGPSPKEAEKIEDHNTTQDSSQSEKIKDQKQPSLETYRRMLKLATAQDVLVSKHQGIAFAQHTLDLTEWQNDPYTCIDPSVHQGIKISLAKMANAEINYSYEKMRSSLRASELYYLPMLMREKRANRSSRISTDALKRIYDANEFCYLQNFGHFIRQQ